VRDMRTVLALKDATVLVGIVEAVDAGDLHFFTNQNSSCPSSGLKMS
jgi:hypothetical protein